MTDLDWSALVGSAWRPPERLELFHVRTALVHPFIAAHGGLSHKEAVLVSATADGITGWGECAALPAPGYHHEWAAGAFIVLAEHLGPALLAGQPRASWGHPMATAGLEAALIDLAARRADVSLAALLEVDGARVPAGLAVSLVGPAGNDDGLEQVAGALEAGYQQLKLKVTPGTVARVESVRAAFPDARLAVDANGSFDDRVPQHRQALECLDGLGLEFIEQPARAEDRVGSAAWADRLDTPVCLDESIGSVDDLLTAVALGPVDMVSVKASRLGGVVEALALMAAAHERGIGVRIGGMLDLALNRSVNVTLAALPAVTGVSDIAASDDVVARDVAGRFELDGGMVAVADGPGWGLTVDRASIDRLCVSRAVLSP